MEGVVRKGRREEGREEGEVEGHDADERASTIVLLCVCAFCGVCVYVVGGGVERERKRETGRYNEHTLGKRTTTTKNREEGRRREGSWGGRRRLDRQHCVF